MTWKGEKTTKLIIMVDDGINDDYSTDEYEGIDEDLLFLDIENIIPRRTRGVMFDYTIFGISGII
jgi:hypothetical protein